MNFDVKSILVSLLFSGVGYVYLSYGKKQANPNLIVCGVALMIYTYFVESILLSVGIGIGMSALPFIFKWW